MVKCIGWTRLELNRLLQFLMVTEINFQSILRRALVPWHSGCATAGIWAESSAPLVRGTI
jgi:hypothetical protein